MPNLPRTWNGKVGGNGVLCEIMREIVRVHHAYDSDRFLVYASPAVAETLKGKSRMRWRKWKSLSASR
ncbi:hypothetical protein LNQ52_12015 [Klebsiella pneumoniae subsp. pneumoniae]|nr:hypothetical protein [Klebsiella pneumoniae subsp. pneumoniae]